MNAFGNILMHKLQVMAVNHDRHLTEEATQSSSWQRAPSASVNQGFVLKYLPEANRKTSSATLDMLGLYYTFPH